MEAGETEEEEEQLKGHVTMKSGEMKGGRKREDVTHQEKRTEHRSDF